MKCPICNTENEPGTGTCQRCGFGLSLAQPGWPSPPEIDASRTADVVPSPMVDALEPPVEPHRPEEGDRSAEALASCLPSEDDVWAREHIVRANEALRAGLLDQAQWELEQARDLADDGDISQVAQEWLAELRPGTADVAQEVVEPQVRPLPRPARRPAVAVPAALDWSTVLRIGVAMGLLNGLATGLGSVLCAGLLLAPLAGFAAGRLVARTARSMGRSYGLVHTFAAGAMAGLGGLLGQMIARPIWVSSLSEAQRGIEPLLWFSCAAGILYLPLAIAAGVLGGGSWLRGRTRE